MVAASQVYFGHLAVSECYKPTVLERFLNLVDVNSESGALCKESFGSGAIQSLSLLTSSMKMERNVQKPLVLEQFCL